MFYPTEGSSNLRSNAHTHLTNSWHHNPVVYLPHLSYSSSIGPKFISTPSIINKRCHNMWGEKKKHTHTTSNYTSPLSFSEFKFTSVLEAPHLLQGCTDVFISPQYVGFQVSTVVSMTFSLKTSVTNYHSKLCNIPEEQRSHPHCTCHCTTVATQHTNESFNVAKSSASSSHLSHETDAFSGSV
jgi:hypothetical protein